MTKRKECEECGRALLSQPVGVPVNYLLTVYALPCECGALYRYDKTQYRIKTLSLSGGEPIYFLYGKFYYDSLEDKTRRTLGSPKQKTEGHCEECGEPLIKKAIWIGKATYPCSGCGTLHNAGDKKMVISDGEMFVLQKERIHRIAMDYKSGRKTIG